MTAGLVTEQLEHFAAAGLHDVVVEPWDGLVAGTEPGFSSGVEYLSDGFFDLLAHAAAECRRLGLAMWLYDGNAAGHDTGAVAVLLRDRPDLAARQLVEVEPGVRYEVRQDDGPGRPRLDRLRPEAAEALLDLLHRPVVERCGPIAGFWTDEPRLWGDVPWADGLVRDWSPVELSSLFRGATDEDRARRVAFWSAVTGRYGSAFLGTIQRFHHQHGMASLVQPLPDGVELSEQMRTTGSLLQTQQYADLPGCDLWPGTSHDDLLRGDADSNGGMVHAQARSAAHLAGHTWAQAEPYGLQGWGVTLAHMKAVADRLLARGINLIAPATTHAHFGVSQSTFCGDFGPLNGPLWMYFDLLHAHVASVGAALAGLRHVAPVALVHPERLVWALDPSSEDDAALRAGYSRAGGTLQAGHYGFDVVPSGYEHDHDFAVAIAGPDFELDLGGVEPSIRIHTPVMDGPVPSTECYHGTDGEADVFFLTNWPVDGRWLRSRVDLRAQAGWVPVEVALAPGGSVLIRVADGQADLAPPRSTAGGWQIDVPFDVSYGAVNLPVPCVAPPPAERAPAGDVAARHPGFVGVASYRFAFTADEPGDYQLDLGDVRHCATVLVDGERVARLPWPPYHAVLALGGEHRITVEIVGTAANAVPGTGYDPHQTWGLFGPVVIRRLL
jgi:hypothetical protein